MKNKAIPFFAILFLAILSGCDTRNEKTDIKSAYGIPFDFDVSSATVSLKTREGKIDIHREQNGYEIIEFSGTPQNWKSSDRLSARELIEKTGPTLHAMEGLFGTPLPGEQMKLRIKGGVRPLKFRPTPWQPGSSSEKRNRASFSQLFGLGNDVKLKEIVMNTNSGECPFRVRIFEDRIILNDTDDRREDCLRFDDDQIQKIAALTGAGLALCGDDGSETLSFIYDPWRQPEVLDSWSRTLSESELWKETLAQKKTRPSYDTFDYPVIRKLILERPPFAMFDPLFRRLGYRFHDIQIEKVSFPDRKYENYEELWGDIPEMTPLPLYTVFILKKIKN